jgi:hypothetical protein
MGRSRNIKPGFFSNDELAGLPFEDRLLFIGLWTVADREGRLLDRPRKIRMEVFPADDVDCDAGLAALQRSGFIERYEVDGAKIIQINNWLKHQKPHVREAPSELPRRDTGTAKVVPRHDLGDVSAPPGSNQGCAEPSPRSPDCGLLTVDSGLLIPDCLPEQVPPSGPKPRKRTEARFDAQAHLLVLGVPEGVARDWLTLRKAKRAASTETAIKGVADEASKAGISLGEALGMSCARGWVGFKAEWVDGQRKGQASTVEKFNEKKYGQGGPL